MVHDSGNHLQSASSVRSLTAASRRVFLSQLALALVFAASLLGSSCSPSPPAPAKGNVTDAPVKASASPDAAKTTESAEPATPPATPAQSAETAAEPPKPPMWDGLGVAPEPPAAEKNSAPQAK